MAGFPLPFSLCNLSSLTTLHLTGDVDIDSMGFTNEYHVGVAGSIPICLGTHLTNLVHLNLSFNFLLTGPIPHSLAHLQSLHSLDLSSNTLSGPIPQSLGHLQSLHLLNLSANHLSGSIPLSLGHLQSLHALDLSQNHFSGSIPHSLGLLQSLHSLDLSKNWPPPDINYGQSGLSGSIPYSFGNLQSMHSLDLSSNRLSGSIPSSFSHMHSLQSLHLSTNTLSGRPFPSPVSLLPNLTSLDLSFNQFSGHIPSFNTSPLLQVLDLSDNSFSGSIHSIFIAPSNSSSLSSLISLDLSQNYLSGEIPTFDPSRFPALAHLALDHNSLSGSPADSMCGLKNLQSFSVASNSLSGSFLRCRMPMFTQTLTSLDISRNKFAGPFPEWIGSLSNLTQLLLSHNNFGGSLPKSWQNLSLLDTVYISGNSQLGALNPSAPKLPSWFFTLPSLYSVSLSSLGIQSKDLQCSSMDMFLKKGGLLDLSINNITSDFLACLSNYSKYNYFGLDSLFLAGNPAIALNLNLQEAIELLPQPSSELDMSSCGLRGHLSGPFFDRIGSSVTLKLAQNSLEGQLPAQLGNLSQLGWLDLSHNYFTGIADPGPLRNLSQLWWLDLSHNHFTEIADLGRLGNLSQLQALYLSHNHFTGIVDGAWLENLSQLQLLDLSHNHFTGIADRRGHLGNLSRLSSLVLSHNNCSGIADLGRLSQLLALDLSHNQVTGFAPGHKLRFVQISSNDLSGNLSSLVSNLININSCRQNNTLLYLLDVSSNFLEGLIPPWLGQCTAPYARGLRFNNNLLQGSIPHELFENSNSGSLVSYNQLQALSLSQNQLTGPLPSSLRNLPQLKLLDLSHNMLKGSLESFFSNASGNAIYTQLQVLLLGYNDFTGSVPPSLGVIAPALQLIDFSNNHLTGGIPVHTLQSLSAFITKGRSRNQRLSVTGTLYEEISINMKGNAQTYTYVLQALMVLDLSGNSLSGPISTGLGELSGLVSLNLSRNRFSGAIPSDLGKLSQQLQALDLSYNELVGPIPASFEKLTSLEVFNVSYNSGLSGRIPNNPQLESAESYMGDLKLCGDNLNRSCSAVLETPSVAHDFEHISSNLGGFAGWIDEWISVPGFWMGVVSGIFLGALYVYH